MPAPFDSTPPSCVLFDFDGTMYAFDDVYMRVWRDLYDEQAAALRGVEFQAFYERVEEIYSSVPPRTEMEEEHQFVFNEMKRAWPGMTGSNERLIEDYLRRSIDYMTPRPGLERLLGQLHARDIPWGIISNHDSRNRRKLEAMDLQYKPATFMLSMEVGVWKPDARIFEMALEEIGDVDRSAAVMIGDNHEADIAGGRSVGMRTVLMNDSVFSVGGEELADMTITGFEELHAAWFGEQDD